MADARDHQWVMTLPVYCHRQQIDDYRRCNGFSLIELLVVIGIIGVLLGILLPTVSATRQHAYRVNEMAASRELIQAYTIYSTENKGWLIPGYVDTSLPKYRDLAVPDKFGRPLSTQATDRWPWRLASYIQYGIKGSILVNDMLALADDSSWNVQTYPAPDWGYAVSLYPSFGLNMVNLGGDLYHSSNQAGWISRASQARQSSRLIVFASAHFSAAIAGYYEIVPPVKLQQGMVHGQPVTTTSMWKPVDDYALSKPPGWWGNVDPRWDGKAVVACLDGHSELLSLRELADMTRWSNAAATEGNPNLGRSGNSDPNWVP